MASLWTLGGLSLPELLRRTARASWQDEVFGQGGRMAFYHFLAIFPSLILFFAIAAHIPHLVHSLMNAFQDLGRQVLPDRVSQLFQQRMSQFGTRPGSGLPLLSIGLAALWAAHNGTWAMIYGLNKAYEVEEKRSWREMTVTNIALTLFLSISAFLTLFLIFCGAWLQSRFLGGTSTLRTLEWLVLIVVLSVSFAVLYRFAPNLPEHAWRWSTPGALCALILWIGATLCARLYFDHVSTYARTYGPLDGVVMLLLWLYITNGAILIGGEMNSEIEKNISHHRNAHPPHAHPAS
ncbi:MAG: YihY/virulence factor BrkB family protein [Acidobacteriaceae bacterium]